MKQYSQQSQSGFTLVELMVSLSLFIIVVVVLIGSLYTVNDASRKVQAMRTVMDNLNFAMESISRTVRTSEDISCSLTGAATNCAIGTQGSNSISMNSTLGESQKVSYQWVRTGAGPGRINKQTTALDTNGNPVGQTSEWQAITSPEIDVEHMTFYVDGATFGDGVQPSVMVQLDGVAAVVNGSPIPFSIQTYLSQRTPE